MKHLNRRKMLGVSLAGGATTVMNYAWQTAAAADQDPIQIGVVGVRGMGRRHLQQLQGRRDVRVAALCDVDQQVLAEAAEMVQNADGHAPDLVEDYRYLLDRKSIDALIVATPNHWHGPLATNTCQAEKDVYVESPCSHVFREGQVLIQVARRFRRIVQHGTPVRSSDLLVRAAEVLDSGILGNIKMCKAWNCRRRSPPPSVPDGAAPKHVNYDLWLGPAPRRPFNRNRFHDHWIWDRAYGNGGIGGEGIHDLDIARWALKVQSHPERITTHGCQMHWSGESSFPDNMTVAYHYPQGKVLLYDERTWTPYGLHGLNHGCVFYGTAGWMLFSRHGFFQVYLGDQGEKAPAVFGSRGQQEHLDNFLDCMRTRQPTTAPPPEAHLSCSLAHLGDIAYQVGEVLDFDGTGEAFRNIEAANQLLKKSYRLPWAIPSNA